MLYRGKEKKCRRKSFQILIALVLMMVLLFTGCSKSSSEKKDGGETGEALQEVNEIPEDGIITKEQFKTVAGKDMEVSFTGETEDGISYTWTYQASMIQNPEDQNLKIDFSKENLDDIKKQANDAKDALKLTMYGGGVIAVPTLTVVLPEQWESDTGLLLKEQGGKLARLSDVTIDNQEEEKTTLVMSVTTLEGDSYIVGGVAGTQNKGASAANQNNGTSGQTGNNGKTGKNGTNGSNGNDTASSQQNSNDDDVENDVKTGQSTHTCTISISCASILNNMDKLASGKEEFVPADGLILAPSTIEFEEGESVHDVLKRVCKEAGIHMESTYTPAYNSAYVEGINQLYEYDCGELSGWMYNVNGWFPNYGCSQYTVSDGDVIQWVYTCDLGEDVGDNSSH